MNNNSFPSTNANLELKSLLNLTLTFFKLLASSFTSSLSEVIILTLTFFNFLLKDLIISVFLKNPSSVVFIKIISLALLNKVSN